MADTILKLKEIEDFFQNLTIRMLGLDPKASKNQGKVRISWPTNGSPAWGINEDIAFLKVNNPDDPIVRQRDTNYDYFDEENNSTTVSFTRVHMVKWIFYGPNAYDNAEKVRNSLFMPAYIEQCNSKNLFLILDVVATGRFPEAFNGQWWERADFTASFNEFVQLRGTVPVIQSAEIITKKG